MKIDMKYLIPVINTPILIFGVAHNRYENAGYGINLLTFYDIFHPI